MDLVCLVVAWGHATKPSDIGGLGGLVDLTGVWDLLRPMVAWGHATKPSDIGDLGPIRCD